MVLYSLDPENPTKSCKSKNSNLHVHFNSSDCPGHQGYAYSKATKYLKDVTSKKQCVPFCHCNGGAGRCAQAKQWGWTRGQWPKTSAKFCRACLKMQRVMLNLRVRYRFAGHWAHAVEQSPQDVAQNLQSPRADYPVHELSRPHRDGPRWKRADCS